MKAYEKFTELEKQSGKELFANAMEVMEKMIFDEIVNLDAICKWAELDNSVMENRKPENIEMETTDLPEEIRSSAYAYKETKRQIKEMASGFIFKLDLEDFEKWVMPIEQLIFRSKQMTA